MVCGAMGVEEHRDWGNVDYAPLLNGQAFPPDFMWGVATASHQIEGGNTNNWSRFEPSSKSGQHSGDACDHWNRRIEDLELIQNLKVTHYRFSLEWSRIEPEMGVWNEDAIAWYSGLVDDLLQRGIQPMVTLHHFTNPLWWEDLGAFEKEANIVYWIRFSTKMFEVLSDRVTWWCTINEPAVYASMGYVLGEFPPGERSFRKTRNVSLNLMRAHARCYRMLKSMENGQKANIGLVKNINIFDPYRPWNPLHRIQANLLDGMFNRCWLKGLKNGRFKPPSAFRSVAIEGLKSSSDFIGLNYYTHLLTTPFMPTKVEIDPLIRPWEERTDFRYAMYAEGLKRAIEMVANLNIPIIVTENGVADDDDDMRPEHVRRHLQITSEAIAKGYDVRGFYHWTLMDNFEWAEGYDQRFGLYHVDFDTQKRTLRKSGALYASIAQHHRMPQVVVLAGGLGSRLGEKTKDMPKPLVEVGGKPMLTHILDWVNGQGCNRVLVLTGHHGEKFDDFSYPGLELSFVQEPHQLGTGGALWNARDELEDEFILLWGDDYHPIDYNPLVELHRKTSSPLTMTVTPDHEEKNLQFEQGRLVAYNKEEIDIGRFNGYEAGTSVVRKSVVLDHGKEGTWSWENTIYPTLSTEIHVHVDSTPFWDIGTPERLERLEKFFNESSR